MTSVNTEAVGGVHSYCLYGKETTWGTPVAVNTHFGLVENVKANINSNLKPNRGFVGTTSGGRNVVKYTPGMLDTSLSIDFSITRWAFMEHVLGEVTGGDPYTFAEENVPPSMTIATNIDNPGTSPADQEATYEGCVIESCTIKTSVGEPVSVSLDIKSQMVIIDTALSTAVALPDEDVYNFSGGSLALPTGSVLTHIIDSVELTIKNTYVLHGGLGSRIPKRALPTTRDYSLKVSLKYIDNALFTAALGATTPTDTGMPTEYATATLTFVNGSRSMIFTLTGVPLSEFNQVHNLNETIGEDITLTPKSCSAVEDRT